MIGNGRHTSLCQSKYQSTVQSISPVQSPGFALTQVHNRFLPWNFRSCSNTVITSILFQYCADSIVFTFQYCKYRRERQQTVLYRGLTLQHWIYTVLNRHCKSISIQDCGCAICSRGFQSISYTRHVDHVISWIPLAITSFTALAHPPAVPNWKDIARVSHIAFLRKSFVASFYDCQFEQH